MSSVLYCFLCRKGQAPLMLKQSKDPDDVPPPLVNCTSHMCPIHVHWHVKQSYKDYWRVKITIMNLNIHKNYTTWNLAVEHPNLNDVVQVFSFNYMPLTQDRPTSKLKSTVILFIFQGNQIYRNNDWFYHIKKMTAYIRLVQCHRLTASFWFLVLHF